MKNIIAAIIIISIVITSSLGHALPASQVSDTELNPERTKTLRVEVAKELEPGAIGNGEPLLNLIKGQLPERAEITEKDSAAVEEIINEAIRTAVVTHLNAQDRMPSEMDPLGKQILQNLVTLQNFSEEKLYLFHTKRSGEKATITGHEDYLLGFNYNGLIGIDVTLALKLHEEDPALLAQYIYHECIPEHYGEVASSQDIDRSVHKENYTGIQALVFGREDVQKLGEIFRGYIFSNVETEVLITKEEFNEVLTGRFVFSGPMQRELMTSKLWGGKSDYALGNKYGRSEQWIMQKESALTSYAGNSLICATVISLLAPSGDSYRENVRKKFIQKHGDKINANEILSAIINVRKKGETISYESIMKELFDANGEDAIKFFGGTEFIDAMLSLIYKAFLNYSEKGEQATPELINAYIKENIGINGFNVVMSIPGVGEYLQEVIRSSCLTEEEFLLELQFKSRVVILEKWFDYLDITPDKMAYEIAFVTEKYTGKHAIDPQVFGTLVDIDALSNEMWGKLSDFVFTYDADWRERSEKFSNLIDTNTFVDLLKEASGPEELNIPDNYIQMFKLRYFEGKSVAQIARQFGKKETQIRGIFQQVISKLRALNEESVEFWMELLGAVKIQQASFQLFRIADKIPDRSEHTKKALEILISENKPITLSNIREQIVELKKEPGLETEVPEEVVFEEKPKEVLEAERKVINTEYNAQLFKNALVHKLSQNPQEIHFICLDSDTGINQEGQIIEIYKEIGKIEDMVDSQGNKLFPNLVVIRGNGSTGSLTQKLDDEIGALEKDGETVKRNNIFFVVQDFNLQSGQFLKYEKQSWISSIDDLASTDISEGSYVPIMESITLMFMAATNCDISAIKNLYDSISREPLDISALNDMIQSRLILILPKIEHIDLKELKNEYKRTMSIYLSA